MLSKSYKQDNTHFNIISVSKKKSTVGMATLLPDKNKAFMARNWFIYLASWNAHETYLNRIEKRRLEKQNQFNIVRWSVSWDALMHVEFGFYSRCI